MPRTTAALLALTLAACAHRPANPLAAWSPTPADASQVATFWMGERPPCGAARVRDVGAYTERGLREAALRVGANAVVGVHTIRSADAQGRPAREAFEGTAVRLPVTCGRR